MQSTPHGTNIQVMDDKLNILLVDDQPTKLMAYEAVLGELGENLIEAHSGMEALEQLLKNDVALVLMDVCMPGMDGFEVIRRIRAQAWGHELRVVALTGWAQDSQATSQSGFDGHITKPAEPEQLQQLLDACASASLSMHRSNVGQPGSAYPPNGRTPAED